MGMTGLPEWPKLAACRGMDPSIFFPEIPRGRPARQWEGPAKAVCAVCEVKVQCLNFAVTNNEPGGIWGGLNFRERRRVRVARKLSTQPSSSYANDSEQE